MPEIVFLGTSGYVPTPERDNAAFLLKAGEVEAEIRAHFIGRLFMPSDMDRLEIE